LSLKEGGRNGPKFCPRPVPLEGKGKRRKIPSQKGGKKRKGEGGKEAALHHLARQGKKKKGAVERLAGPARKKKKKKGETNSCLRRCRSGKEKKKAGERREKKLLPQGQSAQEGKGGKTTDNLPREKKKRTGDPHPLAKPKKEKKKKEGKDQHTPLSDKETWALRVDQKKPRVFH